MEINNMIVTMQKLSCTVLYRNPATIVFWSDGTKTVCKAHGDPYNHVIGFGLCCAKKILSREDYQGLLKSAEIKSRLKAECRNCKYYETGIGDEPCVLCCHVHDSLQSKWELKEKPAEVVSGCSNCKYENSNPNDSPCIWCAGPDDNTGMSGWEPKEEQRRCDNCKYEDKASWENPCFCCYSDRSRWEPKEPNND